MGIISVNVEMGFNGTPTRTTVLTTDGGGSPGSYESYSIGGYKAGGLCVSSMLVKSVNGTYHEVILEDDYRDFKKKRYYTSDIGRPTDTIIYFGAGKSTKDKDMIASNGVGLNDIKGKVRLPARCTGGGRWTFNGETELDIILKVSHDLGYDVCFRGGAFIALDASNCNAPGPPKGHIISSKVGTSIVEGLDHGGGVAVLDNFGDWDEGVAGDIQGDYAARGYSVIGARKEEHVHVEAKAFWLKLSENVYTDRELACALKGYDYWTVWVYEYNRGVRERLPPGETYTPMVATEDKFATVNNFAERYYGKTFYVEGEKLLSIEEGEVMVSAHSKTGFAPRAINNGRVTRYGAWADTGATSWNPEIAETITGVTVGGQVSADINIVSQQTIGNSKFSDNSIMITLGAMPVDKTFMVGAHAGYTWEIGGTTFKLPDAPGIGPVALAKTSIEVNVPFKRWERTNISSVPVVAIPVINKIRVAEYTVAGFPGVSSADSLTGMHVSYNATGGLQTTYSFRGVRGAKGSQVPRTIQNAKSITQRDPTSRNSLPPPALPASNPWGPRKVTYPVGMARSPFIKGALPAAAEPTAGGDAAVLDYPAYKSVYIPKGAELFVGDESESYIDPATGDLFSKYKI